MFVIVRDPCCVSRRTFGLADAQVPHSYVGTGERCAAVSDGGRGDILLLPGPWGTARSQQPKVREERRMASFCKIKRLIGRLCEDNKRLA